ncbi:MAG TPA: MobF family relaxase [Solirubrobacterales bacterium]
MVGVTKIQRGNAGYWLAAVAEGGEDYYTKPGEAPGEWVGEIARDLGLSGQLDAAAYTAILAGQDPTTGEQLLKRPATQVRELPDGTTRRKEAVLGFDVRFSCPKSVSILYALGDEQTRAEVLEIVNDAVRQGIEHLEREACFVRRGEGGKEVERGGGFVGMAFRHRMSRSGDPALHVHAVLSNMTRAAKDGKWYTLASPKGRSPLWLHGKSAGVVFQAALRAGFLQKFGLEFEAVTNGYADLRGFDRAVIDALSTRSAEIAQWMDRNGVDSIEAAQIAAYRTRERKDYGVGEDERRGEWIALAEPHGVSPETIDGMVAEAAPREPRPITAEDLDRAVAALEAKTSHFDRRLILWAVADQLPEGAAEAELVSAVDQTIDSGRVISVHEGNEQMSVGLFTTPRIAELERRLREAAEAGANAGACQVAPAVLAAVLERHAYLGEDQRAMVERLVSGGEFIAPVAAWPGTGKTTALDAAREAWEIAGFPVVGCAVANTASQELKDAGITGSSSIASLLTRTEARREEGLPPLSPGTVIVVDEASMVSTPDLDALRFLAAECGGKLVLIGDPQQIGAIGPGGTYGLITRSIEPATLQTIRRQHRAADREFVALVHEGRGSEALDLLRASDRVVLGDDLPSTLDAMLADWHRDYETGADAVMIARRNRDVDYLNDTARELRREAGALGENEVIVGERAFAIGDRVQTRINREGAYNRERWDVTGVDAAARTVTLRRVGGDERTVTLGPRYLDRRRDGDLGPSLEYAYALTKFAAQGKTVDRAYPLLDGGASIEQELVAVSRGREVANVYAVVSSELTDADLGPGRRELSDELHDIRVAIEREGANYSAAEAAMRSRLGELSPLQLAGRRAELAEQVREADPLFSRGDRLDREIERAQEWAERMAAERSAIEALPSPPARELARVSASEKAATEQLAHLRAERAALPETDAKASDARPLDPQTRLEAALVDESINRLARRDVEAARIEPIDSVICSTLGTFPHADPAKARSWHEGAHAIASYRRRHGITDEANPLGPQPRGAPARAERARAQRRLEKAQRRLGRGAGRGAGRPAPAPRGIGR